MWGKEQQQQRHIGGVRYVEIMLRCVPRPTREKHLGEKKVMLSNGLAP
jgi:hypothetical protein